VEHDLWIKKVVITTVPKKTNRVESDLSVKRSYKNTGEEK
jgi:hypothetical protein